jgi:hypothetical protein
VNALRVLVDAGLHLRAEGNRLIVAPAERLTDPLRELIRQHKEELLETARAVRKGGNPLMTAEQADECHAGGWDDNEIQTFTTRVLIFVRHGVNPTEADDLAERLTLRDREQDDKRMCVECNMGTSNRCPAGAPMPIGTLHRCGGFTQALGTNRGKT